MNRKTLWVMSLIAFLALPLSGFLSSYLLELTVKNADQLTVYLTNKGIYALGLLFVLATWGGLRSYGFERGANAWFLLTGAPLIALTALVALNPEAPFGLGLTATLGWIVVAILISIGEEGVFRGLLWRAFERHGTLKTCLLTSLLFGGVHLFGVFSPIPWPIVLSQAVFAVGVGMTLAAARLVSGSLLGPIFLHALFDTGAILAAGGVSEMLSESVSVATLLAPGITFFAWGLGCVLLIQRRRTQHGPPSELGQPA